MILSPTFVLLSILSAAWAAPSPDSKTKASAVGSLYFQTNGLSVNHVVSLNIGSDGKIAVADVIPTGGKGSHGATPGLDPIFTQGSVQIHPQSRLAVVTNAGSNDFSVFSIDSSDPTKLKAVGKPISSGGDYPDASVFNNAGNVLCVINNGPTSGVQCYTVSNNGRTIKPGSMRSIPLNQTSPPNGPSDTMGTVRFTKDEQHLVATVKGIKGSLAQSPGYLATWSMTSPATLSKTFSKSLVPLPGGVEFTLTDVPGRNAFLGADLAEGVNVYDYSAGVNNFKIKTLSIPGARANCWSVHSSKTNTYFISDVDTSVLTEVKLSADLTPSIVRQYTIPNSAVNEGSIATINGKDWLFLLFPNSTSVGAFRLDGPGQATLVQTLNITDAVVAAGGTVDPFQLAGMNIFMRD